MRKGQTGSVSQKCQLCLTKCPSCKVSQTLVNTAINITVITVIVVVLE